MYGFISRVLRGFVLLAWHAFGCHAVFVSALSIYQRFAYPSLLLSLLTSLMSPWPWHRDEPLARGDDEDAQVELDRDL